MDGPRKQKAPGFLSCGGRITAWSSAHSKLLDCFPPTHAARSPSLHEMVGATISMVEMVVSAILLISLLLFTANTAVWFRLGLQRMKPKIALLFFKIGLCWAISFKRSRRELSIDMAEHGSTMKNHQNTHFPRSSFIPKTGIALP